MFFFVIYLSSLKSFGKPYLYPFAPFNFEGIKDTLLKQNIKNAWLEHMSSFPEEVVFVDGAILGAPDVWKASGHVDNFSDPMIDNKDSKKRYRVDHLIEAKAEGQEWIPTIKLSDNEGKHTGDENSIKLCKGILNIT